MLYPTLKKILLNSNAHLLLQPINIFMVKKKKSYNITNKRLAQRKYMSYKALQQTVQDIPIRNKWHYEKWCKKDKPLSVPQYPWRVYEEWTSWGDFLGTDSEFVPFIKWKEMLKRDWRPYWDAARWVQKQKYKSGREFYAAHKRGEVPKDIPKSPHQVYKDRGYWTGWSDFLGKTITSKVKTMKNIQKLFAIAGVSGYPYNYFTIISAPEGKLQLKEQLNSPAFRVYKYDDDNKEMVGDIVKGCSSPQGGNVYLCNNINSLFFELDSAFELDKDVQSELTELMKSA